LERELNFQQNRCNISRLTLALLLHYLKKILKINLLLNQRCAQYDLFHLQSTSFVNNFTSLSFVHVFVINWENSCLA